MVPVRSTSAVKASLISLCAGLVLALPAQAQAPDYSQDQVAEANAYAPPPHISVVEGSAMVERDGTSEPATANAPIVSGDRLRTDAGRVEVLFPDGTALDVDQYSVVDVQGPALIRLGAGRILLVVAGVRDPAAATRYQIDTPAASARTHGPGEYRVAVLSDAETELAVRRGSASLETEAGSLPIGAGERTIARDGEAPGYAQVFNSAHYDGFDLWAAAQRDARIGYASTQYLPQDLRMYGGTFDQYGSWEYTQPYGYVWYPTVAPDWQPYYHGYWAPYRPWGWTWVGLDFWSWPTHHYGRWGSVRNRWFWIPGRSWGPAWVSWASAPGYVSWCPLGFDGRPVSGFSHGFANGRDGWTIMPRHAFGEFGRADRFAVAAHRIPPTTAFVSRRGSPVAIPARAPHVIASAPASGGIAVPRGSGSPSSAATQSATFGSTRRTAVPRWPASPAPPASAGAIDRAGTAVPRAPVATPRQPAVDARAPGVAVPRQPAIEYGRPAVDYRAQPAVPRAQPSAPPRVSAPSYAPPRVYSAPQAVPRTDAAPQMAPRVSAPPSAPPRVYSPPPAPQAVPRSDPAPQTPAYTPPRYSAPQAVPRGAPAAAPAAPSAAPRAGGPSAAPRGDGGSQQGRGRRQ
jgi:FecR protein